jgi:hypothetical protein
VRDGVCLTPAADLTHEGPMTNSSSKDTYLSDWFGTPIDDQPTQLAGHGERVIGICGRKGLNVDALGLVVLP